MSESTDKGNPMAATLNLLSVELAAMTEAKERAERERDRLALELVCRQCVNGLRGRGCLSEKCMFPNVAGKVAKWVAYAKAELKGVDHA